MNKSKYLLRKWPVILAGLAAFCCAPVRAQEPQKLALKDAVTLAVKNSHEIALARAQYVVAESEAGLSRSAFLPNIYTGSGVGYTYGFPTTPGGAPPSVFDLAYTQSVFNLPARGQVHAAEDRAEGKRVEMDKVRDSVMVSAASDYLELAKVRHSLDLLRTEQTSEQQIRDVTQQRVDSGLELSIEATRMDLALARTEQRIVQLQGRGDVLAEDLHDLTGIPADRPIEVSAEDLPQGAEMSPEEMVSQAVAYSPDVKEAESERAAQTDLVKGERGGYWPTVDLVGTYNVLSRINNYDEFYNSFQRNNVNAGVQITIPLFSAHTRANVALARSELTSAELTEGAQRRGATVQARQNIRDVREADAAREVARLDLKLAQENLSNVQSRYDQGHATLRDLEQARVDENEKWVAFLDTDFSRQKAQLALWQATGELAQHLQ